MVVLIILNVTNQVFAQLSHRSQGTIMIKYVPKSNVLLHQIRPITVNSNLLSGDSTDANGIAWITNETSSPILGYISLDGYRFPIPLYLENGMSNEINVLPDTVSIQGSGRSINSYLYLSGLSYRSFRKNTKGIDSASKKNAIIQLDRDFDVIAGLVNSDQDMSARHKEIVIANNSFLLADLQGNMKYQLRNNSFLRQYLGDSIILSKLTIRPDFLDMGMESYTYLLHHKLRTDFFDPTFNNLLKAGVSENSIALKVDSIIRKSDISVFTKDYLLAKSYLYFLDQQGLTSQIKKGIDIYLKEDGRISYREELNERIFDLNGLQSGKKLPAFLARDLTGQSVELLQFKGKVLYIDIWATWCKPCLEEFHYSKKLSALYSSNKNVEIIYLSIDSDVKKWERFVKSNPELKGYHLNQAPSNDASDIWNIFGLTGIPRYILVDKDGNILKMNASRPSSGSVLSEINKALQNF